MQRAVSTPAAARRFPMVRPHGMVRHSLDSLPWMGVLWYGMTLRSMPWIVSAIIMITVVWFIPVPLCVGVSGWGLMIFNPAGTLIRSIALSCLVLRVGLEHALHRRTDHVLRETLQAEAHIRGLFAGTAHNIKHPLTTLQTQLHILDQAVLGTPVQMELLLQATLPRMHDQVTELQSRVAQTLDLVRHAVLPLRCQSILLGTLYAILQPMLDREQQTLAPVLQLAIRCDQPDALVWTDPAAICWCVENLVRNAVQAQRSQAAAVVTIRLTADQGQARMVTVEDCGPGFPEAVLVRGYADAAHEVAGHGLGLFGVQATLSQLGARLVLTNRPLPASGAIATIVMPAEERIQVA